jgi:hypothetical protein
MERIVLVEIIDLFHRPTKRGKEKSLSDGHCQYKKEMDDLYWRVTNF